MQTDRTHAHAPRTAVQAVVAVLLALVVAAAAPLAGGQGERTMATVLLVQGLQNGVASAAVGAWSLDRSVVRVPQGVRSSALTSRASVAHRGHWRTALPPPFAV